MTNPMTGVGQVIDFVGFSPRMVSGTVAINFFSNPFSFLNTGLGVPTDANGFHFDLQLAPVPEPSSLALVGVGLAGAAAAGRRLIRARRVAAA